MYYSCVFNSQGNDTLIHKLHDKQIDIFTDLMACFVKAEFIKSKSTKKLVNLKFTNELCKHQKICLLEYNYAKKLLVQIRPVRYTI